MKTKHFLMTLILAASILLGACAGSAQAVSTQAGSEQPSQSASAGRQPGEMPQAMKLALGTLKLDGSANAVTAEQAKTLLPLWKAARSLSNSQTSAAEEVQAVFTQIEKAMTADQMAAMDAMQLKMEDMQTIAKELGIEMGGQGSGDPQIQATMQAARATAQAGGETLGQGGEGGMGGPPPGGGTGMGGGPGMGGPGMDDSSLSDEAKATAMAQRSGQGVQVGLPPALIDAIIKALEARAQS